MFRGRAPGRRAAGRQPKCTALETSHAAPNERDHAEEQEQEQEQEQEHDAASTMRPARTRPP